LGDENDIDCAIKELLEAVQLMSTNGSNSLRLVPLINLGLAFTRPSI
jgi:hypothetical protein